MTQQPIRVAVVYGGRSSEHDISILSATSVINAIDRKKYQIIPILIQKDGTWFSAALDQLATPQQPIVMMPAQGLCTVQGSHTTLLPIDIVFPVLHGPFGEDGTIQGLLDMIGLPYVGAGVLSSALGMDKAAMKALFKHHGLPVVPHCVITRHEWQTNPKQVEARCLSELPLPWFVKPANMGSSVGISKVKNIQEFATAMDHAALFDLKVLVETGIQEAREIEIAVLGNHLPQLSIVGEIITSYEFYDYNAKYRDDQLQLIVPAEVDTETLQTLCDCALKAFTAIDCRGLARVDYLVRRTDNQVFLSEINTMPGFTNVSMYPKLWQASGISYTQLIDQLLSLGLAHYAEKQCNQLQIPAIPAECE